MPKTMLQAAKEKYQILVEFIKHLSKKQYSKCNKIAEKIQFSLANQAKTCIQHLSIIDTLSTKKNAAKEYIKKLNQEINSLNEVIETIKKLKGIKLSEDKKQMNENLSLFDLIKKGYYVQANRSSKNPLPFIHELIQYRQLKRVLFNGQRIQANDYFYGGKQYRQLKQTLIKSNQKYSQLQNQVYQYILKINGQNDQEQWQKPQFIQKSIFQEIQRIQFNFRSLLQQNRKLRENFDQNEQQESSQQIQVLQQCQKPVVDTILRFRNNHSQKFDELQHKIKVIFEVVSKDENVNVDKQVEFIDCEIRRLQQMNKILNRQLNMNQEGLQSHSIIESLELRRDQLEKNQSIYIRKFCQINDKIASLITNNSVKLLQPDEKDFTNIQPSIQANIQALKQEIQQINNQILSVIRQKDNYKNEFNRLKLIQNISEDFYSNNLQLLQVRSSQGDTYDELRFKIEQLQCKIRKEEFNSKQLQLLLEQEQQENVKLLKQQQLREKQFKQLRDQAFLIEKGRNQLKVALKRQTSKYKHLEQENLLKSSLSSQRSKNLSKKISSDINLQGSYQEGNSLQQSIKKEQNIYFTKYQQVTKQLDELTKKYNDLIKNNKKLDEKYKEYQDQTKEQLETYQQKIHQMAIQNEGLSKKLKRERQLCDQQVEQIANLNKILEELQNYDKQQEQMRSKLNSTQFPLIISEAIKNTSKIYQKQQQFEQLLSQYKNSKEQIKKNKQRIKKLQADNLKYIREIERVKKDAKKIEEKYQKIKKALADLQEKLQQNQRQKQSLNKQLKQIKQKVSQPRQKEKQINNLMPNFAPQNFRHRCTNNFFTAKQVFEEGQEQRKHLIKILQQEIGTIYKTKLLYSYDPLNRVNFHRYIDNHKNLLVIVKTVIGKLIAAYSQSQLSVDGGFRGKGLLMPLWDLSSVFHLIQGNRPVSYDDYFLIYGNAQIRIRSQENKVFSNFGIANGYFDNQRKKVVHLLGQDQREVDLETYEVYQVIFERDLQ